MIEITKEQFKKIKYTDAKQFYKSNLQGKNIENPILGKILFTQLGLGETFHRTKRNIRPFICLLKELVETASCDGQLYSLYKPRKDRIVGFYHLKNIVKLAFLHIYLDILIGEDQDGKKYYMFKKDPQGNLGEVLTSHREPSGSNYIIIENDKEINPVDQNLLDFKDGEEYWIGDTIKIMVEKSKNFKESNKIFYHGSNYKFNVFDKSKIKENKLGLCFNFTDDYSIAYQYGDNIIKAHLDLNNPVDFNHKLTYEEDCLLCDIMGFPKISKERFEQEQSRYTETIGSLFEPFKMKPKFIKFLQALGYDGIAIPEEHHYGVFEPEQIHIINNSPQINKFLENKNLNDNFWTWFGSSKTVKANGDPIIFYHATIKKFDTFKGDRFGLVYFAKTNNDAKQIVKDVIDAKTAKENPEIPEMNMIPVYIKAEKIFTPSQHYELIWPEVKQHMNLDLDPNSQEYQQKLQELTNNYNKIKEEEESWLENNTDKSEEEKRQHRRNVFKAEMELSKFKSSGNIYIEVLNKVKAGHWAYYEQKDVINKIFNELKFDALELSENGETITTIAVMEGKNQIKSIYNNGDWSSSNNIYEVKEETKMSIKKLNEEIKNFLEAVVNSSPEVKKLYRELVKELHPDITGNNEIGKFLNRAYEENNLKVLEFIKDNKQDLDYVIDVLSGKKSINQTKSDNDVDLFPNELEDPSIDKLIKKLKSNVADDNNFYHVYTGYGKKYPYRKNLSATELIDFLFNYVEKFNDYDKVNYESFSKFVTSALKLVPMFSIKHSNSFIKQKRGF